MSYMLAKPPTIEHSIMELTLRRTGQADAAADYVESFKLVYWPVQDSCPAWRQCACRLLPASQCLLRARALG